MRVLQALVLVTFFHSTRAKDACIEGFVMDEYCINLGSLLDNRAVKTLENPELHSVHCLADVSLCYKTDFHILTPNPEGSPRYASAVVLDQAGHEMALAMARDQGRPGHCTTCVGSGTLRQGFRATFVGEVIESTDANRPATLKVKKIMTSPRLFNESAPDGCPKNSTAPNLKLITEAGGFKKPSIAHGSLMIIGWGLLLPTGVSAAHFLKHRPNALWFKIHRIIQVIGLIFALVGWIIALVTFDALESPGTTSFGHAVSGMVVMVLGLLQPINALIRPHPPKDGEDKATKRLLWEIAHKASGYIAVLLAAVTICFGTIVIFDHNEKFRAAWIATLVWVAFFSVYAAYDRYRHKNANHLSAQFSKS